MKTRDGMSPAAMPAAAHGVSLGSLLRQLPVAEAVPSALRQWRPARLQNDSRRLTADDLFLAYPGAAADGRDFLSEAAGRGVAVALVEAGEGAWQKELPALRRSGMAVLQCQGLRQRLAEISGRFYRWPDREVFVLAVTGTAGKTTCAWLAAQILSAIGQDCGYIGTLGAGYADEARLRPLDNTTPDPLHLRRELRLLADCGAQAVVLEASSEGLAQGRLRDCQIQAAALTNLGRDHLESHGGPEQLRQAKRSLFEMPSLRCAVLNLDDPFAAAVGRQLAQRRPQVELLGVGAERNQTAKQAELRLQQDAVAVAGLRLQAPQLPGRHNLYNLACAAGLARAAGADWHSIAAVTERLSLPPGRLQKLFDSPACYLDYAHTPESLLAVLQTLHGRSAGQLWVVFGCGGQRDLQKRPLMGEIADRWADRVVLTDDNPRAESSAQILGQIAAGMKGRAKCEIQPDRRQAIEWALGRARRDDCVLLAGRGHEQMQYRNGAAVPLSDADCALQWHRRSAQR